MPLAAIEGIEGSFSHLTAQQLLGEDVDILSFDTFRKVYEAVDFGDAEYGVVPVENFVDGHVNQVYNLAAEFSGRIYTQGEFILPIQQLLIGCVELDLDDINDPHFVIESHPVAIGQSERWLEANLPLANRRETSDTAGSVQEIMEAGDPSRLAIAGHRAIEMYGGVIVAGPITPPRNATRFKLLGVDPTPVEGSTKTTFILSGRDEVGLLRNGTAAFADNGINMKRIWQYTNTEQGNAAFYVDVIGNIHSDGIQASLTSFNEHEITADFLGCYPEAAEPEF